MSDNSLAIATSSRAANYGDGCFTTIAVLNSRLHLADYHLKRLQSDCKRLGIDNRNITVFCSDVSLARRLRSSDFAQRPVSLEQLMALVDTAIDLDQAVLKILISRGNGGRGYSPTNCSFPEAIISVHAFPQHYAGWRSKGIVLGVSNVQLAIQPLLAGLKHLNRLEQVFIKQALNKTDFDDVLVTTTEGELIEASAANVFWLDKDGKWCTPQVANAGVDGVYRRFVIGSLAKKNKMVQIAHFTIADLMQASAVLLCNAVMQIVPVRELKSSLGSTTFAIKPVQDLAADIQHGGD